MILKVLKVHPNAKLPRKEHSTDVGYDVFYCPEDGVSSIKIAPHSCALIPTGIRLKFPSSWMVEVKNKSGIASKKQLLVGSCVIDSGYTGEVFVNLHNMRTGGRLDSIETIEPYEKVAQLVCLFVGSNNQLVEIDEEEYDFNTTRGEGCLGSTGNQ